MAIRQTFICVWVWWVRTSHKMWQYALLCVCTHVVQKEVFFLLCENWILFTNELFGIESKSGMHAFQMLEQWIQPAAPIKYSSPLSIHILSPPLSIYCFEHLHSFSFLFIYFHFAVAQLAQDASKNCDIVNFIVLLKLYTMTAKTEFSGRNWYYMV